MTKEKQEEDNYKLTMKKDFASYVHSLKMEQLKAEFTKQTSIVGLKSLIKNEGVTKKELKELWKSGEKMFSMRNNVSKR